MSLQDKEKKATSDPAMEKERKSKTHIKNNRPVVVPVVINGFWRAFTKKGLTFKKVGTILTVRIKPPLNIDYNAPVEEILSQVMEAIEQSKDFMLKGKHHALKEAQSCVKNAFNSVASSGFIFPPNINLI